jgi:UDP-3-O-[3-hydroxymyristoyl] glucosamine N-acyltransferase
MTLAEVVGRLNALGLPASIKGDADCVIEKVASLADAKAGDVAFLANPKFKKDLTATKASAVIVAAAEAELLSGNAIVVDNPHLAYAHIASWLYADSVLPNGIDPSASIDGQSRIHPDAWIGPHCMIEAGVVIGAGSRIGPGCVIQKNVRLGEACQLIANVTVTHDCQLGNRVILHPGVVIGADGFGLANDQGKWVKVPQVGKVVIGDDVEVGANSTIDRGALYDTVIEQGVKLDNLIHIAHNVRIGAHTAIAACAAVAGSTQIGRHCAIGGAVGIVGHLKIADNVTVKAMSFVSQSIREPGVYSSAMPLQKDAEWHRNFVRMKQLDAMAKRIKQLEKRLDSIHQSNENKK